MGDLVPATSRSLNQSASRAQARIERNTQRALAQVNQETLVRVAKVQGEAIVQGEKIHEIDRLAHDAMNGQALLYGWETHLAGDDPVLRNELHFFSDMAKLAKGEVIADTIVALRRT